MTREAFEIALSECLGVPKDTAVSLIDGAAIEIQGSVYTVEFTGERLDVIKDGKKLYDIK